MSERALLGQRVLYRLNEADVAAADAVLGHTGNRPRLGEQYPADVVAVWGGGASANLQVRLDGPGTLWVTSRGFGDDPGNWQRPEW